MVIEPEHELRALAEALHRRGADQLRGAARTEVLARVRSLLGVNIKEARQPLISGARPAGIDK